MGINIAIVDPGQNTLLVLEQEKSGQIFLLKKVQINYTTSLPRILQNDREQYGVCIYLSF